MAASAAAAAKAKGRRGGGGFPFGFARFSLERPRTNSVCFALSSDWGMSDPENREFRDAGDYLTNMR